MVVAISNQADVIAPLSTDRGDAEPGDCRVRSLEYHRLTIRSSAHSTGSKANRDARRSWCSRMAPIVQACFTSRRGYRPRTPQPALVYAITIGSKALSSAAELAVVTEALRS